MPLSPNGLVAWLPTEQSCMLHTICDIFLLLVAVVLAIRCAVLLDNFGLAAQLADDVRSIMLHSGGPIEAQTSCPIRNGHLRCPGSVHTLGCG